MPREITDADGVTWSCIQAFASLGNGPEKADAARVGSATDRFHVMCTPNGGAKSVRLELVDRRGIARRSGVPIRRRLTRTPWWLGGEMLG